MSSAKVEYFESAVNGRKVALNVDPTQFVVCHVPSPAEIQEVRQDYINAVVLLNFPSFEEVGPGGKLRLFLDTPHPRNRTGAMLRHLRHRDLAEYLLQNFPGAVVDDFVTGNVSLDQQRSVAAMIRKDLEDGKDLSCLMAPSLRGFTYISKAGDLLRNDIDGETFNDMVVRAPRSDTTVANMRMLFLMMMQKRNWLMFPLLWNVTGVWFPVALRSGGSISTLMASPRVAGVLGARTLEQVGRRYTSLLYRGHAKLRGDDDRGAYARLKCIGTLAAAIQGAEDVRDLSPDLMHRAIGIIGDWMANTSYSTSRRESFMSSWRGATKWLDELLKAEIAKDERPWEARFCLAVTGKPTTQRVKRNALNVASTLDPRLSEWEALCVEYVKNKHVKRSQALKYELQRLLDYIMSLPADDRPLHPDTFSREEHVLSGRGIVNFLSGMYKVDNLKSHLSTIRDFFDWYGKVKAFNFVNPIRSHDLPNGTGGRAKTEKEIMPVRIMKLCREIISENNYAWPRTLDEDYVEKLVEGHPTKIWCPVRAICIYTLLILPLRGIQVRCLDDGTMDDVVFRDGQWRKNDSPVRAPGRHHGFLTQCRDAITGETFTGFYVNTNKTPHAYDPVKDQGWTIPWKGEDLIDRITYLIDWNERYNPVERAYTFNDLPQQELHVNVEGTAGLTPYRFLFRDPNSQLGYTPITSQRLKTFFYKLLDEAERRLRAAGEKVTLVTDRVGPNGLPNRTLFTLHSLRASGITAFALAGVPVQVISEFIAGHATIIMNLYYQRLYQATVHDAIETAWTTMNRCSAEGFQQFLADQELEKLIDEGRLDEPTSMGNGEWGMVGQGHAFGHALALPSGIWSVELDGMCPNGASKCHLGGSVDSEAGARNAVPGGRRCGLCRYWLTGPSFLAGQVVRLNEILYRVREKGMYLRELSQKLAGARGERHSREVRQLENAIGRAEAEIWQDMQEWAARYQFAILSSAMSPVGQASDGHEAIALITRQCAPTLQATLQEGTDYDLLNFVATASEILPGVDVPSARLRKAKLLDRILAENGLEPFLFRLSDDQAKQASYRLGRLLDARLGREGMNNLVEGNKTLASFGLTAEMQNLIKQTQAELLRSGHAPLTIQEDTP
ncbi:MAG TPA: VPA1269 family protein [Azospirillum sp.]|nr:VPA1269 family protein [Azospirillum sp.]